MRINADFSKRVVIRPDDYEWVKSPAAGVERMMLDRIGEEVARATTIVRFAPESYFDAHTHGGGEEFFVLEGVFSDETEDYPAGTYVRNPIGTSHTPHTKEGCTILVKLHQFDPSDRVQFHTDTTEAPFKPGHTEGVSVLPLHSAVNEEVRLVRFAPGARVRLHSHKGGEEIFVLDGTLEDEHGTYPAGTWLRSPDMSEHAPFSDGGCLIYMKTGHLPKVTA
ncbi:cupin domain-containing protein [Roseovarius sp.]|uniref:cupin domain-containing protein n=1 Tax=Roseovarius sp. TaxID=1486281 RepID=UPI0026142D92|nr:cupin domain-containing protein [Roseovarius sp.]